MGLHSTTGHLDRGSYPSQNRQSGHATLKGNSMPQGHAASRTVSRTLVSPLDRFLGGVAAGCVAGAAMYLTLAAFAVSQGRGPGYPLHAVHALMSGKRVLPDHPIPSLKDGYFYDWFVATLSFFVPAVAVALVVTWWTGRRARRRTPESLRLSTALLPVAVTSGALFLVLVVQAGFNEASPQAQRISSGYGIRQLGISAWVTALVVYVSSLSGLLGYASRLIAIRRRSKEMHALRGERDRPASR